MYSILENKIIPAYYNINNGISKEWLSYMKNSIISTGGNYSMARMITDYTSKLYIPLCNVTNKYFKNLETVTEYNKVIEDLYANWNDIEITQNNNLDNISMDAGKNIEVSCNVKLPNINEENIEAQVYYGKILDNGLIENISIIPMELVDSNHEEKIYTYKAKIELKTGGNYGYTFRVMPKSNMILDAANLDLVKWITK